MRVARSMGLVNRAVTNKVVRRIAPSMPPYALIHHTGRKSGRPYRTPVSAFGRNGVMAVPLPYGDDADWVLNVIAAGGGEITYRRRTRSFTNPRVLDRAETEGLTPMARAWGRVAKTLVFDLAD